MASQTAVEMIKARAAESQAEALADFAEKLRKIERQLKEVLDRLPEPAEDKAPVKPKADDKHGK